ncbi:MAG: phospholipase A [Rubrivivax sp.]
MPNRTRHNVCRCTTPAGPCPTTRRVRTALLAMAAWFGGPGAAMASSDALQACLLRAFRDAAPTTTVAELRQGCQAEATAPAQKLPPAVVDLLAKAPEEQSVVERRTASELRAVSEPFALLPHRPNYLLPLTHHERPSGSETTAQAFKSIESHFQISFKFALSRPWFDGRMVPFFGYTGRSWWQVYDSERSRPFREYNHEPELLLAMPSSQGLPWGWRHRLTMLGFNHQSNGREVPASRSWNRLTAEFYADQGQHAWSSLRVWQRIPERAKRSPTDSEGDDNPLITRYLGHAEWRLGRASPDGHNLTLMLRRSLHRQGHGAVQLDWSHPAGWSPSLRAYAQVFSGYGDSLIDYNHRIQRIGIGLMLNDWF